MGRRQWIGIILGLMLLTGLVSGTAASAAQDPLARVYTWERHGLSVRYPDNWTVQITSRAISLHPADRDVSDGLGPELVLFEVEVTGFGLDAAMTTFIEQSNAEAGASVPRVFDGRLAQKTDLTWSATDAVGGLMLINVADHLALGIAYIVRANEAAAFLPIFEQMLDSMTFGTLSVELVPDSLTVMSVQLPERYDWDGGGLTFYYPAGWQYELNEDRYGFDADLVFYTPDDAVPSAEMAHEIVVVLTDSPGSLEAFARAFAQEQGAAQVDPISVAGRDGFTFESVTDHGDQKVHNQAVIFSPTPNRVITIVLYTTDPGWAYFRPVASAFVSSIERLNPSLSWEGVTRIDRRRQDGPAPFVWEEYGVTVMLPEGWQTISGGQDFDLALVSPEASETGEGAYILLRHVPSLGTGATMESALGPVAEDVGSEVQPVTLAGLEGVTVDFTDEQTGALRHLILIPYGAHGQSLYIQTNAQDDAQDATILEILNSLEMDPPLPNAAAIDAAWQQSLAESQRLTYGSPDAPVHMVEFFDYSCPHCVEYAFDVQRLSALETEQDRLFFEWVILDTIGADVSNGVAQATYCAAEQGKGYTAYEALFAGYRSEGRDSAYSREGIERLLGAPEVGVDVDALNACLDEGRYAGLVDAARTRGTDAGVTGTPTVLLGAGTDEPAFLTLPDGTVWRGGIPAEYLRSVIAGVADDGLSIADALSAMFGE